MSFSHPDHDGGQQVQSNDWVWGSDDLHAEPKEFKSLHELSYGPEQYYTDDKPCTQRPKQPMNANLKCTLKTNSCKATCLQDYEFPNGDTSMHITCEDGVWSEIPSCEPICLPPCQNNGICLQPGECACPENFVGTYCEQEKKLCLSPPALPRNSKRSCNSKTCTITCATGYRFPDGTSVTNMVCSEGRWVPTRKELAAIPDCQAVCTPPCENGGHCLSHNTCQCSPLFRGPSCQYSVEVCSPKRLQFNGAYNCSGDNNHIACVLSCPQGVEFEYPPQSKYICMYEKGHFEPSTVPKCKFYQSMMSGHSSKRKKVKKIIRHEAEEEEEDEDESYEKIITQTKIKIKKGKKGKGKGKGKAYYEEEEEYEDEFENMEIPGIYSLYLTNDVNYKIRTPKPAICMTWNGNKVKTFDGLMYDSNLYCSHILVQDYVDGSFSVILRSCPFEAEISCSNALEIFLQDLRYTFDNEDGDIRLFTTKKQLPIPSQLSGMRVTLIGHKLNIILETVGITIHWDGHKMVSIEATAGSFNRTAGLCGTMDQSGENDFMSKDGTVHKTPATFVDSWRAATLDVDPDKCTMSGNIMNLECPEDVLQEAISVCKRLVNSPKFSNCLKECDKESLLKTCTSDYCYCSDKANPAKCACDGISVLAKDCQFRGVMLDHGWRDMEICPISCKGGRIYKPCGPSFEPYCGSTVESSNSTCHEGCFCPEEMIQNEGECIHIESCPCQLRGKTFKPGSQISKDCNTCTCEKGSWTCSDLTCGSRCSAIGDPHYLTFDGKRFDFMGKCSYYLVKTDNFSIEAENVACPGTISEEMFFGPSGVDLPSCTKSVTINIINGDKIKSVKLKQGRQILVDGLEIEMLPIKILEGVLKVKQASSTMILVTFYDGLKVWWDGTSRVYIDAPPEYRGKTKGLCGTFSSNIQDDFLTPEGDIESSVTSFANKWKTKETCQYVSDGFVPHPCHLNIENKEVAIKTCEVLKEEVFGECHWSVDVEPFYEDCLYDVCACKGDVSHCVCPVFAAYSNECSRQGVVVNWRHSVHQCAVQCPAGQIFEECGDECFRTCTDIQLDDKCTSSCVEGCRCPPGLSLNDQNECIPTKMCPCMYKGMIFNPGYKEVRPGAKYLELCTCSGGRWSCDEANDNDRIEYPPAADMRDRCLSSKNEEFTTCEPSEPKTCKNMLSYFPSTTADCRPGCVCKSGYVLDVVLKECVLPKDCSCHHGHKSYSDGQSIVNECNTCICKGGSWECTTLDCPATCTTWGDSHFETYDGKDFDFQGACSYVLSKGMLSGGEGFSVTIQNVLCGSLGVTCSKSVTVSLIGPHVETITLVSDEDLNAQAIAKLDKLSVHRAGIFVVVEAPGLGLQIKWDRGTRVYVKLTSMWNGKVQGLCGNFNGDAQDDLKTPSSGIETSPVIFGDSWKLQDFCAKPTEQIDTCEEHPQRKTWAQRQCGILKTDVFKSCHSEVPVDMYMKRCIYDSCACDQGGDCECLCTALAAYAMACSMKGIPIRWRTPDLCPMQCDPHCSEYNACVPSCPVETCDNILDQGRDQRMCNDDTCVEGCKIKPCPDDQIYLNSTFTECVPKSICKHVCMERDGITYYEGDLMDGDACSTCRCSRGKVICIGSPCQFEHSTAKSYRDTEDICKSGWSPWINQDKGDSGGLKTKSKNKGLKVGDNEPLPTLMVLKNLEGPGSCGQEFIKHIECRTVNTHLDIKTMGEDVECGLEKGLRCFGSCSDYEIRVFCACEDEVEIFTLATPTKMKPTPSKLMEYPTTAVVPIPSKSLVNTKCDPAIPHIEYPGDCYKFLHCSPMPNGNWEYVEKTCGPTMMFNPVAMICDWIYSVVAMKPWCGEPEPSKCPAGEVWSDCAVPCGKACHYFAKDLVRKGLCTHGANVCEEGCVDSSRTMSCPPRHLWRDNKLCVGLADCPCMSNDGSLVMPGATYKESECEVCQCIDSSYSCDTTSCEKRKNDMYHVEDFDVKPTASYFLLPKLTIKYCRLVTMIEGDNPLPDSAFGCSSYLGSSFKPQYSRLNSKPTSESSGSWSPEINDQMQYLEIGFTKPEPLFGIIIRGSPIFDQYVTSFKILHSFDGVAFHYLVDETKHPQIFSGCIDSKAPVKSMFKIPIEAKSVRIYPLTWHGSISIRVELLGCSRGDKPKTTTTTPIPIIVHETTHVEYEIVPLCEDPMGVENGLMKPNQVQASSTKTSKTSTPIVDMLKLSSSKGWAPNLNTPNEFVVFDFLQPSHLTGIQTKGGDYGWVSAFTETFDSTTVKTNFFQYPVNARYLKIVPTKWHETIELKAEPLGCFKLYPDELDQYVQYTAKPPEPTEIVCDVCPGVLYSPLPVAGTCRCYEPLVWNGYSCVPRTECPCLVGHIQYAVGAAYHLDDCSSCLCTIGGVPQCKPRECPPCGKGLRPMKSATCVCLCEPCPINEVLCQTSGDCIPEKAWCDGIQDCPDDEIMCSNMHVQSPKVVQKVEEKVTIIKTCPEPKCPPGFNIKESGAKQTKQKMSPMFQTSQRTTKTTSTGGVKTSTKKSQSVDDDLEECIEFICIPERPTPSPGRVIPEKIICPEPECPKGYEIVMDNHVLGQDVCAKYSCELMPLEDAVCNVTGKTFSTFDETEFKYDICDHILARDLVNDYWSIQILKNCTAGNFICSKELTINDKKANLVITLYTDLSLMLDGYKFTVEQLQKSTHPKMDAFVLNKVGNTIVFVSNLHSFWVTFDEFGDVKIGVCTTYIGKVDGLCGYFNGFASDDKRLPSGEQALSTVDFGDGWFVSPDKTNYCEPRACPKEMQDQAWAICNTITHDSFKSCAKAVNKDRFISKCLETACDCLMASTQLQSYGSTLQAPLQECKCSMLQNYAVECLTADENVILDTWRSVHECEISCAPPLVHKDCYRRKCEPSCDNVQANECNYLPGSCFSGCYCPDGKVRKGNDCVSVSDCKDCVCDGFGKSQYITYDRNNFTFDGNCTYLLTRDVMLKNVHTFQVYTTLGPCESTKKYSNSGSCTQSLHILYGSHIVHLQRDDKKNTITTIVDGIVVNSLPLQKAWIEISLQSGREIKIDLPESQVEVKALFDDMSFSISLPSVKYGSKLEGLCGDCNGYPDDDLKVNPKAKDIKTNNFNDVIKSWLSDDPALPNGNECLSEEVAEIDCIPLPPDQDPCLEILNEEAFGECNLLVDPIMYLSLCQKDMCKTGPNQEGACAHVAAYAKECSRSGICVDWKKNLCKANTKCPTGMIYKACGCEKTCETVKQQNDFRDTAAKSKTKVNYFHSLTEDCSVPIGEGCFCPDNKINQNGKCIPENQCYQCDDEGHFPGDKWFLDKCNECECGSDGKVKCVKLECSSRGIVCEAGFKQMNISDDGECCPVYKCVPEPKKPKLISCPDKPLPQCGPDQYNKMDIDADGCSKYICECKPIEECQPLKSVTLRPGEVESLDQSGCCPVKKVICDKSKCPPKILTCSQEFYDPVLVSDANECCDEYVCKPPKNLCLIEDKEYQKYISIGESWQTSNPCINKKCITDPIDGKAKLVEFVEECFVKSCPPGFEMQLSDGKCCGTCVQTKCAFEYDIYGPGQVWHSQDNCTTYKCIEVSGQFVVNSMLETCPDITDCPDYKRYFKGCCQYCKDDTQSLSNCLATSLGDSETIQMVEKYVDKHGICKNVVPIRGYVECNGACNSGTRYNRETFKQKRECECCSVARYDEINVKLVCDDGYSTEVLISVPSQCSCQPCDGDYDKGKSFKTSSFKVPMM
ncbi:hypothetical protein HA402_005991 [Bradysia odoriphaga]|nr:hypothetical protein HA402_005991 [Bradysia odoriphaga]